MSNMYLPETPDESTAAFIKCAFPNGLLDEEYFPLLYILRNDMSIRAASSFVGMLLGKQYMEIYNDALGVNNKTLLPDSEIVAQLKQRLIDCGYEMWLHE
ncbi:MAG: DUF3349 domain-containing protein [Chloroflexota bacterium]